MATIKVYTDIEQSKKLVEILPIESADMYFSKYETIYARTLCSSWDIKFFNIHEYIPCWSLAALLDVLPTGKVLLHDKGNHGYKVICNNIDSYYFNSSVDACVEMIIKLYELNLLYYD